ncbi:MAG: DUF1592 domain-containing protein [Bryobacteraceae bacterium]
MRYLGSTWIILCVLSTAAAQTPTAAFRQHCFACHGKAAAGGINLEQLTANASMGEHFQQWQKVATALEQKRMPPAKMPQLSEEQRIAAVNWIRGSLKEHARRTAGDPGRVTMRRLTSGEYAYTVRDLTGLDFKLDRDFVSDSVGGEGFTNFGDVQFLDDANLERYLATAKIIASHAVIGAGPLRFYDDPGKSGMELSAINRIQEIYFANGFRSAAGEGAKPYGLERYAKAFHAAWRYQHRAELGQPQATLASIAKAEGLSVRFVEHIWAVLNQANAPYPTSEIVARFRKFPNTAEGARKASDDLQKFLTDWPRMLFAAGELAAGGQGDERALVLTEASVEAKPKNRYRFGLFLRSRTGEKKAPRIVLMMVNVNPDSKDKPTVVWRNPMIRFRNADRSEGLSMPLREAVDETVRQQLAFGTHPAGASIGANDFVTVGASTVTFNLKPPEKAAGIELLVDAEMIPGPAGDAVLRTTISESEDMAMGRPVWALLADTGNQGFKNWKAGVLQFGANLPLISHGEPNPSDRDPIPPPFNNNYNQPERDHFHAKLKYFRDDRFLVEKMLDDASRKRLDQAWADLLLSFEYHDEFLRFVARKYKIELKTTDIEKLNADDFAAMPAEPRKYATELRANYDALMAMQRAARDGHVAACLELASEAWRRPLTDPEKQELHAFYAKARQGMELDHPAAVRALLTRILVAPAFLYRLEKPAEGLQARPLNAHEVASRLSYFLWSSLPDAELRRAADTGVLITPQQMTAQTKRMLMDVRSRRLATEFFGQWLGFYRFDQHTGVDTKRFPEFSEPIKAAMYDEAVSFFEHIVRHDRPVSEMLYANYAFLNKDLAKFYGINKPVSSTTRVEKVDGANEFHRGGLLRLGAVLTATSAPLRTSPVKRGDWMLRRIMGTPVPPPPADAGSIPADEKSFGGLSLREKLEAHKRNATCAGCHTRIDPLGFPLERYDSVGRWRETYSDGKPVDDTSEMADKKVLAGVDGLLDYIRANEAQVLRTFYGKLLGYALGRTVLISDQPLLDKLVAQGGKATFSQVVAEIAASPQFRNRKDQPVSLARSTRP